jgi:Flp pilus assembly pilin Flp
MRRSRRRLAPDRSGRSREEGQGLVEYGLLLGLVATTVMFAVANFGVRLLATYSDLAARLPH